MQQRTPTCLLSKRIFSVFSNKHLLYQEHIQEAFYFHVFIVASGLEAFVFPFSFHCTPGSVREKQKKKKNTLFQTTALQLLSFIY